MKKEDLSDKAIVLLYQLFHSDLQLPVTSADAVTEIQRWLTEEKEKRAPKQESRARD